MIVGNRLRLLAPPLALTAALMLALAPLAMGAQQLETVTVTEHPEHGSILTTAAGMTLYTYAGTEPVDETAWPAFTVATEADLAIDVDASLGTIATVEHEATGQLHVTLDGQPLYLHTGDVAAGDAVGHGMGDVWSAAQVETEAVVNGEGEFSETPISGGLTITAYTGDVTTLEADGVAHGLISAFATVDGEFVGYVFGAPAFVNAAFTAQFDAGLQNEGLIVRAQ